MKTFQLNTYDVKSIIDLNNYLISLKTIGDVFEYLASYLNKNFNIKRVQISINEKELFLNYTYDNTLLSKDFFIQINDTGDILKLSILYYEEKEIKDINQTLEFLKTTFNIIAQTIYNKYLKIKLIEISLKDSLTGLYNREYINEYLKKFLVLSKRERKKIAFLKIGIDHFKAVIDEFDYKIGNEVLKELAKVLSTTIRSSDIIARIEADEFLIILHNISNENNAVIVTNKIINNFKEIKVIVNKETNQTLQKTVCIGISIFPDDVQQIDEIFKATDIALYEAKNKGRSQYFKYDKEINTIEIF